MSRTTQFFGVPLGPPQGLTYPLVSGAVPDPERSRAQVRARGRLALASCTGRSGRATRGQQRSSWQSSRWELICM
jgi:hypothetical protein